MSLVLASVSTFAPNPRAEALAELHFGRADADAEENLDRLFILTDTFAAFIDPKTLVVEGPKGAGKSAFFDMVTKYRDRARALVSTLTDTVIIVGTAGIYDMGEAAKAVFYEQLGQFKPVTALWHSHLALTALEAVGRDFASGHNRLLGHRLRAHLQNGQFVEDNRLPAVVRRALARMGLHLRVTKLSIGVAGIEFGSHAHLDPRDVLDLVREYLAENGLTLWILLDKLDEISENRAQRRQALTDLLQLGKDISTAQPAVIRITAMIRSDLMGDLQFASADHFPDRTVRLSWKPVYVLPFLVKRILDRLASAKLPLGLDFTGTGKDVAEMTRPELQEVFGAVFPDKVSKMRTLDWMIDRLRYGNGEIYPRDLINLCNLAKGKQMPVPSANALIGDQALIDALPELSMERRRFYLNAIFPELSGHLNKFTNLGTPTLTRDQLAGMFAGLDPHGDEAIRQLHVAGVIRAHGGGNIEGATVFEVPHIFRNGLAMTIRGPR